MDQPKHILPTGTRIRTNDVLDSPTGILTSSDSIARRAPNRVGVIVGVVGGHGGDIYWVTHDDAKFGATPVPYCWSEFSLVVDNWLTGLETMMRRLTEKFPPASGCAHNFVFRGGRLELAISIADGNWYMAELDPEDYSLESVEFADRLVAMLAERGIQSGTPQKETK